MSYVFASNAASRRVLEKTGFELVCANSNDPRQLIHRNSCGRDASQAIGIYPSAVDARAAFDRLSGAVAQCAALHADGYEFTVSNIDPSTLTTCFADDCRVTFAVRSSVLIGVSVQHFARTSDQISTAIVQAITNRITGS